MPQPVFILVHPGSLATHAGSHALDDAIRELETHNGPLVIIDGFLSDKMNPFEFRLLRAFERAVARGDFVVRLWGCDGGEKPFKNWPGYASHGIVIDHIHPDQEVAAAFLAPIVRSHDAILTGAWATHDGSSGCVNSVGKAMVQAGWPGVYRISDTALYEDEIDGKEEAEETEE